MIKFFSSLILVSHFKRIAALIAGGENEPVMFCERRLDTEKIIQKTFPRQKFLENPIATFYIVYNL